jgi:ankyrin repeat protein
MLKKENPELEFHQALNSDREELARAILLSHPGLDINKHGTIHWAAVFRRDNAIKYLLSLGCKLDTFMLHDSTPLYLGLQHYSEVEKKIDMAARFLKAGANVNLGVKDGDSPLMLVYDVQVGKFLLNHGADVNMIDKRNEWTVLMKFCDTNRKAMIELILKEGFCHNINHIGQYGYTALLIAVEKGYADIVDVLLKYGADPTIVTPSGRSLLDIKQDPVIRKKLSIAIAVAEMQKESAAVSGKMLQPYEESLPMKDNQKDLIVTAPAMVIHDSSSSIVASAAASSRLSPEDIVSFIPSSAFQGMKPGYQFRNGDKGVGYYNYNGDNYNHRDEVNEGPSKITKKKGKSNSITSFFFGSKASSSEKKADGSYKDPKELEKVVFDETSNRRIIENQNMMLSNSNPKIDAAHKSGTIAAHPSTPPLVTSHAPSSSSSLSGAFSSSPSTTISANARLTSSVPPYSVSVNSSSEIPTANAILMIDEQQTTLYNDTTNPLSSSSTGLPDWNFILNKMNSLEKKLQQCEQTIAEQQKEISFLKSKMR